MEQGHAHDVDRPVAKEDFDDIQQDRRTGTTKAEVKKLLLEAYESSANGTDFAEAIAKYGLRLCRETRHRSDSKSFETYVVVDASGERHSPRRLLNTKIGQLRERWADFDTAITPSKLDIGGEQPVLSKQQIRIILLDAYRTTDSGAGFEAALADQNLLLCRGARRAFVVVDAQGKSYSPPRLLGVKTSELKERWSDIDSNTLLLEREAKSLRESQWARIQEERASKESEAIRESMTAEERQQESKLLAEIAALEAQLYEEFRREPLGSETHAATVRLGLVPDDFEQWQQQYAVPSSGSNQYPTVEPDQAPMDQRSLITQLQHWQTIAASDSERPSPQDGSIHGTGHQTASTEKQFDSADIQSWGLSPTTLLMIQTYGGRPAEAEQLRRIEAALAAASLAVKGAAGAARSQMDGEDLAAASSEKGAKTSEQDQEATTLYLRELGQQLRKKGRKAYTSADRWLAERLARRGYSRQQTRRVIARSSPELMEQGPGQRVGYIRRIVERVYLRKEQWQEQLMLKRSHTLAKKEKISATDKANQRNLGNAASQDSIGPTTTKQQLAHQTRKPSDKKSVVEQKKEQDHSPDY